MNQISLYIPGLPPSVNHQNSYGRGRVWKKSTASAYQTTARVLAMEAMNKAGHMVFTGPCSVSIDYYFPDKRRRDAANYNKVLLDAFSGVVYQDDRQIGDNNDSLFSAYPAGWKFIERKFLDRERPRAEVRISW